MPRSVNISLQNNFSKGLVTEATGLSFPENACTESDNCTFNSTGEVNRRLGIDFEDLFTAFSTTTVGKVVTSFLWKNVAGRGDLAFAVVQVGDSLLFYKVSADSSLSSNKHATVIDLTTFIPGGSGTTTAANIECQFSSGNGLLFVTHPRLNSFYVTYSISGNSFTTTVIDIQVRDFEGDTADPQAVSARPTTTLGAMNDSHQYNLENQGWTSTAVTGTLVLWDTARTDMPSNADVSWYYKNSSNNFDFAIVDQRAVGNSPAPKGHFIYSLYNFNRSSNVSGATNSSVPAERVATSTFHAGRVFYSGLATQSSKIFFSQIVEAVDQYGKCYQTNDPTSEELFDLLPSDGGVINIQECGTIIKMFPMLNALIVVASNGVWSITGSQGVGFAANDYSVNKISSTVNISHTSYVDAEGIPFWWNLEGIYTVKVDPQTNSLRVESVSDKTIRSFFLDIAPEAKQFARGIYDQFTKTMQWIYKSRVATDISDRYCFDRILVFNMLGDSFYGWSVGDDNVCINSVVNVAGSSGAFEKFNVINGVGNNVEDSGNQVIVFQATSSNAVSIVKYFVSYDSGGFKVTWAEQYKTTYKDWESFDSIGEEFFSHFITGYTVKGQAARKFQSNYVYVYSRSEEDSSFKIRGQWNYSNLSSSGHWTTEQVFEIPSQTFVIDADFFAYKPKRIKIRGHGLACQFKIHNNGTNPFFIIGWSVFETSNKWI